jgi:hypothetical protein
MNAELMVAITFLVVGSSTIPHGILINLGTLPVIYRLVINRLHVMLIDISLVLRHWAYILQLSLLFQVFIMSCSDANWSHQYVS